MGNREALLRAAQECVSEQGFAATTARDVAQRAGVSLAAIGYHFGSTEALLTQAVFDGIGAWGETLAQQLTGSRSRSGDHRARLAKQWDTVVASFEQHRGVLAASYELMAQAERREDVRAHLAASVNEAKPALADMLFGADAADDPVRARVLGEVGYTILSGLLTQWLLDPALVPRGKDLVAGLQAAFGDASEPPTDWAGSPAGMSAASRKARGGTGGQRVEDGGV